jgi:histidinol-phosphate aminotransferase
MRLAVPGARALQPYQPGKPIDELEREYGVRNVIKLASNENPLGPSPKALLAAQAALADNARYPDGAGTLLKAALARHLRVRPAQVTLGNGSNDVLELAARTFVNAGDEVIFSQHAFAVYPIVTQAVGGVPVVTPAREWGHDLDAMARAVTARTKLVFIANPNNPTGTWFDARALSAFLDAVPARVIVVLDEAYFEYVSAADFPNGISLLARYPNLVVTRTFSKIYGLAGLRLGYGLSSEAIADPFNRVRQPFNVNSLAQVAGVAALEDSAHLVRSREVNDAGMWELTQAFTALGLSFIPSVGNFISVRVGSHAAQIYDALLREGVIVRPVANYGMPEYLRVTVGLPAENTRFVAALTKVLGRA